MFITEEVRWQHSTVGLSLCSMRFRSSYCMNVQASYFRDGPLENLGGAGAAGEVQKKIFAQGKIERKKIHARQLTLKNIHAMA